MFPILLKIGPLTLHTYGLLAVLGIFTGIKTCIWQASKDGFSGKEAQESLYQMAFHMVVSGLLGARIFYVSTHWDEFTGEPLSVFKIWQGGLVFYGGFIGAVLGLYFWNRLKAF